MFVLGFLFVSNPTKENPKSQSVGKGKNKKVILTIENCKLPIELFDKKKFLTTILPVVFAP